MSSHTPTDSHDTDLMQIPCKGSKGQWQRHLASLAQQFNDHVNPAKGFAFPEMGDEVEVLTSCTVRDLASGRTATLEAGAYGTVLDATRTPGSFAATRGLIGLVVFFKNLKDDFPHGITIGWDAASCAETFTYRAPCDIPSHRMQVRTPRWWK